MFRNHHFDSAVADSLPYRASSAPVSTSKKRQLSSGTDGNYYDVDNSAAAGGDAAGGDEPMLKKCASSPGPLSRSRSPVPPLFNTSSASFDAADAAVVDSVGDGAASSHRMSFAGVSAAAVAVCKQLKDDGSAATATVGVDQQQHPLSQ